jgi:predicted SnoaL-like aldol condensation-catalyzing enzyme
MANDNINSLKSKAVDFLKMVISGKIDEAYEKYTDPKGKHHNPYFPEGFTALKKGMKENHALFPQKKYSVKNVIGDADMVAVHSHLSFRQNEPGMIVVHIFRFEGDRIAEFWDCGQVLEANSPNRDGAF